MQIVSSLRRAWTCERFHSANIFKDRYNATRRIQPSAAETIHERSHEPASPVSMTRCDQQFWSDSDDSLSSDYNVTWMHHTNDPSHDRDMLGAITDITHDRERHTYHGRESPKFMRSPTGKSSPHRAPSASHCNVVDQPGKNRVQHFRVLAKTTFPDGSADTVGRVRIECLLLEHILMGWLATYTKQSVDRFGPIVKLCPSGWEASWLGLNGQPPLKQQQNIPKAGAVASLTPAARIARVMQKKEAYLATLSPMAVEAKRARDADCRKSRTIADRMLKEGASAETVRAFRDGEIARGRTLRTTPAAAPRWART